MGVSISIMKFLLIASFPQSILKFRGKLIQELKLKGFEVHVAAPNIFADQQDYKNLLSLGVVPHNISLSRKGMNPLKDIKTLIELIRLVRFVRPNYVLCYTIKPIIYGMLSSWLLGVQHRISMVTGVGIVFTEISSKNIKKSTRLLIKCLYFLALRFSTKIIFQNNDDHKLFLNLRILKKHSPTLIVNGSGVDLIEYNTAEVTKEHNFLIIARLNVSKGIREFVDAARIIKSTDSNINFTVVGWIDEGDDSISKKELQAWVDEGIINYLGILRDVRPAIENCSVYVLPSYREGLPRSVLEAMSMCRPIITTDAPGCRETVVDGENGYLVRIGDVETLVEAMKKFIANPDLIDTMGARSLKIVKEKYDVNIVNREMLRFMEIT